LNYTQSMLIQFMFFGAYFIMSMPAGAIVSKIGFKRGIVVGLTVTGIGALFFYPAAVFISYPVFLFAFFVLASGITILQVAANPFVTILGSPEGAASRLNLTQAFNSLGTTIAPLFGTYMILDNDFQTIADEAQSVQGPYIGIALTLFLIAVVFAYAKLPKIQEKAGVVLAGGAWGVPYLVLGAVGIFVYVGAEVSIGSFLVNYLGLENIANMPESSAGNYVAFYWGGAMVGRFLGSAVQQKVAPNKVLVFNALFAIALVLITMLTTGHVAMWSVLLIGLFNSIMFPTIFSLAIRNLGNYTAQGSGILIMAIVGGAILPVLMGYFADTIGIQKAFFMAAICYAYIAWYGWKGYSIVTKKAA